MAGHGGDLTRSKNKIEIRTRVYTRVYTHDDSDRVVRTVGAVRHVHPYIGVALHVN